MLKAFSGKKLIVAGLSGGFMAMSTVWHNAIYSLFTMEQITALIVAFIFASAAFLIAAAGSAIISTKKFIADRFTH